MQKIKYSAFADEAEKYWEWSEATPSPKIPPAVAREGAGSELRTPIMHYGVVAPVYLAVARYLGSLKLDPKKKLRLIELGSGSGRPLTYLKSQFPQIEIWGVDYSAEGIAYAKKSYGKYGVKFKHVPAQDTSLKAGYFDFVISSHVIEHVTEKDGKVFLEETKRLLKKGGIAFIGTPERRRCQELYTKNPTMDKKYRLVPPHEWEYTLPELKTLAEDVFAKGDVRVDMLLNPTFHKIFKSSINKFKPKKTVKSKSINFAYRNIRDKAPRPFFDTLTRIGAKQQMKKHNVTFKDVLFDNSIAAASKTRVPDNLLLVCEK